MFRSQRASLKVTPVRVVRLAVLGAVAAWAG